LYFDQINAALLSLLSKTLKQLLNGCVHDTIFEGLNTWQIIAVVLQLKSNRKHVNVFY